MELGQVLYALKLYNELDFVNPLIKSFYYRKMEFEEVFWVDTDNQVIELFSGPKISYEYLVINSGNEVDESLVLYKFIEENMYWENNLLFHDKDFEFYEQIHNNLDIITKQKKINFLLQKDFKNSANSINMAYLLKTHFQIAEVYFYSEEDFIHSNPDINQKLLQILSNVGVEVKTNCSSNLIDNRILVDN